MGRLRLQGHCQHIATGCVLDIGVAQRSISFKKPEFLESFRESAYFLHASPAGGTMCEVCDENPLLGQANVQKPQPPTPHQYGVLTKEEKALIRIRKLAGEDIQKLADEYDITPIAVGLYARTNKLTEQQISELQTQVTQYKREKLGMKEDVIWDRGWIDLADLAQKPSETAFQSVSYAKSSDGQLGFKKITEINKDGVNNRYFVCLLDGADHFPWIRDESILNWRETEILKKLMEPTSERGDALSISQ
jgi:hypothetical protein